MGQDVGDEGGAGGGDAELFRMALAAAKAMAWVWDVEADTLAWFGDAEALYGVESVDGRGPMLTFFELVAPEDQERVVHAVIESLEHGSDYEVEYRSLLPSGEVRWHRTKGIAITDDHGRVTRLLGMATDITERRVAEEELTHLALHDSLTGLANRALLLDRLSTAMVRRDRAQVPLAVLFVDLDGFKAVNDRSGHAAGDRILTTAADRLRLALRPADTIARLGGDEFVIVAEVTSTTEGSELAARLVAVLAEPYDWDGTSILCPASIGVHMARNDDTLSSLMRRADGAMYEAKRRRLPGGAWATSARLS